MGMGIDKPRSDHAARQLLDPGFLTAQRQDIHIAADSLYMVAFDGNGLGPWIVWVAGENSCRQYDMIHRIIFLVR